jgi:putative ABC transport system permease protein
LVVSGVATALVLLIGAGLMMQTLWRLGRVEPGFRAENVLTLTVQPTGPEFQSRPNRRVFYRRLFERIETLPGVESVGAIQHLPLSGGSWATDIDVQGQPLAPGATPPRVGWRIVGGDYFRTMGIPLRVGRVFAPTDRLEAAPVVVVNELMAKRIWPGETALGKRIRAKQATADEWATVIGIVGNVRHRRLDAGAEPELYRPLTQYPHGGMTLAVRTSSEPLALARPVSDAIWAIGPNVPITGVRSLEQVVSASVAEPRLTMLLLAVFAAVGLALGGVGVYGVVAHGVAQRTREIGIRIALGAETRAVIGHILGQGMGYAVGGVGIGLVGAMLLSRFMKGLVFEVSTTDPTIFAALSLFLVGVAVLASYVPARRASRVDPVTALRDE